VDPIPIQRQSPGGTTSLRGSVVSYEDMRGEQATMIAGQDVIWKITVNPETAREPQFPNFFAYLRLVATSTTPPIANNYSDGPTRVNIELRITIGTLNCRVIGPSPNRTGEVA
jgi:hypothetical protein